VNGWGWRGSDRSPFNCIMHYAVLMLGLCRVQNKNIKDIFGILKICIVQVMVQKVTAHDTLGPFHSGALLSPVHWHVWITCTIFVSQKMWDLCVKR